MRVYNDHAGAGGTSGRGRTRRVMGLPFTERGGIGWDNTVLRTYIAVIGASLGTGILPSASMRARLAFAVFHAPRRAGSVAPQTHATLQCRLEGSGAG